MKEPVSQPPVDEMSQEFACREQMGSSFFRKKLSLNSTWDGMMQICITLSRPRIWKLYMWGSFGVSVDLPKLEDSDMAMDARLKTNPEMEVTPKLLCYWGLKLLAWHVGIIWGKYWSAKTRGHRCDHGGQNQNWSWNGGHPTTIILWWSQTSALACGDHLGSVLICQN